MYEQIMQDLERSRKNHWNYIYNLIQNQSGSSKETNFRYIRSILESHDL